MVKTLFVVAAAFLGGLMGGFTAVHFFPGAQALAQRDQMVLEARRVVLRDTFGHVRAILGENGKEGTGLWMFDREGATRASFSMGPPPAERPFLMFDDQGSGLQMSLGQASHGMSLVFKKRMGRPLVNITTGSPRSGPRISLADEYGRMLWESPG